MELQLCNHTECTYSGGLSDDGGGSCSSCARPAKTQQKRKVGAVNFQSPLYQRLRDHEIRIVMLDPVTQSDDVVQCHFKTTSIQCPAPYAALSYAWGNIRDDGSHLTHEILCNETPLKVTETLHQALLRLAQNDSELAQCYWIDAICINQSDPLERSAQVMIMDKIYSNANQLFVWFGEGYQFPWLISALNDKSIERQPEEAFAGLQHNRQYMQNAAWFKRRWVIQEVMNCRRDHTIVVGPHRFSVTNLVSALSEPLLELSSSRLFASMSTSPRQRTLFANLTMFRHTLCSDDRDLIYSLRSISSDGGHLPVDYTQTADELFVRLALLWITRGYTSQVLSIAAQPHAHQEAVRGLSLPSWVPDWRSTTMDASLCSTFPSVPSLSDLGMATLDAECRTTAQGTCLHLRGWVFPRCRHQMRDRPRKETARLPSTLATTSCCWARKNTTLHDDLALVHRARSADMDAVLLTEGWSALGLKLMHETNPNPEEHVWTLLGTQKLVYMHEGFDGPDGERSWHIAGRKGMVTLPKPQSVYLK